MGWQRRDQVVVTSDDLHAVVSIISIICVIFSAIAICIRLFSKIAMTKRVTSDDYTALLAWLLSAAQTAAVLVACHNGLGQRAALSVSSKQRNVFGQSFFASWLLYIPAIICTKLSLILFLKGLVPGTLHAKLSNGFIALVFLWGTASEIANGTLCGVHTPWKLGVFPATSTDRCLETHLLAFWNSFNVLDAVTDLALVVWPCVIVYRIKTSSKRRIAVMFSFALRLVVVSATVVQIVFWNRIARANDYPFDVWPLALCTQVVQAASLITACIPYAQPFLDSITSGLIRSDYLGRRGVEGSSRHKESSVSERKSKSTGQNSAINSPVSSPVPLQLRAGPKHTAIIYTGNPRSEKEQGMGAQDKTITCTTSVTVAIEPRETSEDSIEEII